MRAQEINERRVCPESELNAGIDHVFPAVRGIQAHREYYVSMCPIRLLPKLFKFDADVLAPQQRAQRHLNKSRIPELSRYITENTDNYVFSALTVSVDGQVTFELISGNDGNNRVGLLRIPASARFIINDGQHRRAAVELALREKPEIGDETIAVVFFLDKGLERCQQMFADLNRYSVRPSKSLGILYDHRDETAQLVKKLISTSEVFNGAVEFEKTSLAPRSHRLFTLSAIYNATSELLADLPNVESCEAAQLALEFWETVAAQLNEWKLVRNGELTAGELRAEFIHTNSVVLHAVARTGRDLMRHHPNQWKEKLEKLNDLDWRRSNSILWEGRSLVGGKLAKAHRNVVLTSNAIKMRLGVPLSEEEQQVENAFGRRINVDGGK